MKVYAITTEIVLMIEARNEIDARQAAMDWRGETESFIASRSSSARRINWDGARVVTAVRVVQKVSGEKE